MLAQTIDEACKSSSKVPLGGEYRNRVNEIFIECLNREVIDESRKNQLAAN